MTWSDCRRQKLQAFHQWRDQQHPVKWRTPSINTFKRGGRERSSEFKYNLHNAEDIKTRNNRICQFNILRECFRGIISANEKKQKLILCLDTWKMEQNLAILVVHPISFKQYEIEVGTLAWWTAQTLSQVEATIKYLLTFLQQDSLQQLQNSVPEEM